MGSSTSTASGEGMHQENRKDYSPTFCATCGGTERREDSPRIRSAHNTPCIEGMRSTLSMVAPFENGKPALEEYDDIYGCFLEEEVSSDSDVDRTNAEERKSRKKKSRIKSLFPFKRSEEKNETKSLPGKLYRLVWRKWGGGGGNPSSERWFFYNDTTDYKMVVSGCFGAKNEFRANKNTKMWREVPTGLIIAELEIPPLSTLAYIEGVIQNGFDLHFHAIPVL